MTYSGNKLFNSNNLFAIIILLAGGALSFYKPDNFPFFIPLVVAFVSTACQAFYFEITMDKLIVKNYIIPLLNIRYNLNEITQIQLLRPGGRSAAQARLKIIHGGKSSFGFPAASLKINDWKLCVDDLCEKKISVEVEPLILQKALGIIQ